MPQTTNATYTDGVLHPDRSLDLRDNQRVRVIVEPLEEPREDRAEALSQLKAGIASMHFFSNERMPSREELHER